MGAPFSHIKWMANQHYHRLQTKMVYSFQQHSQQSNIKLWLAIRNLGFKAYLKAKKTMVRSNLEYSGQLWNYKNNKGSIELLEGVRIGLQIHSNYRNRIIQLNLLPLSYIEMMS